MAKSNFTIDGESWERRDPNATYIQPNYSDKGDQSGREMPNKHSNPKFNPLYRYEKPEVLDAAKEAGIQNVNKRREVDQIIAQIEESRKKSKENKDKDMPKDDKNDELAPPKQPTEQEIAAEEFKNQKIAEIRGRLEEPRINVYENYAGKDDLIARNKSQSSATSDELNPTGMLDRKGLAEDWLDQYIFQRRQNIG